MEAQIERRPECLLLRIGGDFRLWNHEERESELLRLVPPDLDVPGGHLVLSLAGLTHVDSRGIGALVRIPVACSKRDLKLIVVMPAGMAGEVLHRTNIFRPWPRFADEAAALQSVNG